VHWGIALGSMRPATHMSMVFGSLFLAVAVACLLVRRDVLILGGQRRILVRTGIGRLGTERAIAFGSVKLVRVILVGRNRAEAAVSLVCREEDLQLPPTSTPRQEGLLLAMTLGVRLEKVYGDGAAPEPAERIAQLYRNEDAV
jgi:hypothetical protein